MKNFLWEVSRYSWNDCFRWVLELYEHGFEFNVINFEKSMSLKICFLIWWQVLYDFKDPFFDSVTPNFFSHLIIIKVHNYIFNVDAEIKYSKGDEKYPKGNLSQLFE